MRIPAINTWRVTTEGDCEGRTIRDLGVHTGSIIEIAKKLSGESYYSLDFKESLKDSERQFKHPRDSVSIRVSSLKGYNDVNLQEFQDMTRGLIDQERVSKGQYSGIQITFAYTEAEKAKYARDAALAEARENLSPETFKLLIGDTHEHE